MKAKSKKRPLNRPLTYPLLASSICEHLKIVQDGEKATDWYFRVHSRFTRALTDHLLSASEKKCIVDRDGHRIACHRGTGAAITFRKPILHFAMPGETQMLSLELRIGYEPNEDDMEYETRNDRDIERAERIHFPADLETDFSKPKFDLWIHETQIKMRAEQARPEHKLMEKLLKKHPDKAMELITKQRQKGS